MPQCPLDQGPTAPLPQDPPVVSRGLHRALRTPTSEEGFPCHLLSVLQLQPGTWGVTGSSFNDNSIYAPRRVGQCTHSQAEAFYSKQKHPLHPLKSLF